VTPGAVIGDASGRMYIADPLNNVVRRINLDGTITTVAGKIPVPGVPTLCVSPDEGLPATQVCLHTPLDLALDPGGNLYIANLTAYQVRKVDASGVIRTVAGTGGAYCGSGFCSGAGFCGDGGPATAACLTRHAGLAFDQAGNLLVSIEGRIRRIDSAG